MKIEQLLEIVRQYERHEWKLRRVLMERSADIEDALAADFPDVAIVESDISALWFSRRSIPEHESWEIRRVDPPAYALVEVIPDNIQQEAKEDLLKQTELRLFDRLPHLDN
jgi:hypothetical protein